jgi:hypothetical protein
MYFVVVAAFKKRNRLTMALVVQFFWILIVLSIPNTRADRYLMFLWPLAAIVAVYWLPSVSKIWSHKTSRNLIMVTVSLLYLLFIYHFSFLTPRTAKNDLRAQPTFTILSSWIRKNIPPNEVIGINSQETNLFARALEDHKLSDAFALQTRQWLERKLDRKVTYYRKMTQLPIDARPQLPDWVVIFEYKRWPGPCPVPKGKGSGCLVQDQFMLTWRKLKQ